MKIDLDDLYSLVAQETRKALIETIDPELADEEKERQEQMAKSVSKLGIKAEEDSDEIKEQEDDEEETGVPETIDTDEDKKQTDRTGGKGTKDSPKLDTPPKQQLQTPSVGAVIDKLNALRGGRSLKDPGVKKSFSQYFKNLTSSERTSLLAFLTGMSQILAGVADGSKALDPSDVGVRVKSIKSKDEKTDAAKSGTKKRTRPGSEEQPIVVGESRKHLKSALYTYKVRK